MMASYFDEHNCEPLRNGEAPDHLLHMARLLLDSGVGVEFDMTFNRIFGNEKPPPPTSKKVIADLRTRVIRGNSDGSCAICLKKYDDDEEVKELPCKHEFHASCILPWLQKTNSCPVCRHELPTDDADYEEFKRQMKRAKQHQEDLDNLHNSMFG